MSPATPALSSVRVADPGRADLPAGVERIDYTSDVDGAADWALAWPPAAGADWLVCIHGHGSGGDQLYTRPDVRDAWVPAFRRAGLGVLTPHARGNAWMGPAAARDVAALLGEARARYGARRFIFASGSMGGTSNLIYAALRPGDVAGVVALCPATDLPTYHAWCRSRQRERPVLGQIADAIEGAYGGPPAADPALYRAHSALHRVARLTMPVAVVHGAKDEIIPPEQARDLAAAAARAGLGAFSYVEQPEGHHDSPLPACEEALHWVLERLPRPGGRAAHPRR